MHHSGDVVHALRNAVNLSVAGVGIGQGEAAGIDNLFCAAQVVVFKGDRVAVAPVGIREFPPGLAVIQLRSCIHELLILWHRG